MVGIENPGIQAIDVWRKLEDFTPVLVTNPDNGAVPVSMHNITGRGTWVGVGFLLTLVGVNVQVSVTYNIDGAGAVTRTFNTAGANQGWAAGMPLLFGFETSLVVTMALSAGGTADFWSSAVVE